MNRLPFSIRGVAAIAGAFVFVLASAGVSAEDTYTIKLKVSPGEKWSFDVTSSFKQNGQVMANGQPAQQIDQNASQHRKGTVEVLSADGGQPTALRIAFDADSANTGSLAPQQQVPPFALAGKTVTLHRAADGTVTNDLPEQPDAQTIQELDRMIEPDRSIYPGHPVAMGEEWEPDTASLAKQFQAGPDDKVSMKCKLTGLPAVGGRKVAEVTITGSVTKTEQGFVVTTTTLSGDTAVDLLTGQPLEANVTGRLSTKGSKQVPGQNGQPVAIEVNADGTMEIHQSVRPLNSAPAAPEADAPPAPRDAPPMRDNPLSPRPSFAGSFKGDPLSLELAGDSGQYTGTMTLADKKFPVAAHADGDKLTGTFDSDGMKFDFTATMDSGTLTVVSGGATYSLKKAAANPLAQPQPKNPLAQ